MSITQNGTTGMPSNAPVKTKEWSVGIGETETQEWPLGTPTDVGAAYATQKAIAEAGGNIAQLTYRETQGRASLVARFGRSGNTIAGEPADVTVIEELYAQDVIVPIYEAPYFDALDDNWVLWVVYCVENRLDETEITAEASRLSKTGYGWANWAALAKELRHHLSHGKETYLLTDFILRRSRYGVRTSEIKSPFTGINTVVTAPTFKTQMDKLILALPSGEWLKRPPQAEHLGKGRWRVTEEWQWALKWSKVYGGTWGL